jgi:hypothetical protein
MKHAVARPTAAGPRFFTGKYEAGASLALLSPSLSPLPDEAKAYEDRGIAEIVASALNALIGIETGENVKPWIVIELPEAWT